VLLPYNVLEGEPNREPTAIVDASGGRNEAHSVEHDRRAHPLHPRVRVAAAPEPERNRKEDANDDRVEVVVVVRPHAELSRRTNETPTNDTCQHSVRDALIKREDSPNGTSGVEDLVVRADQLRLLIRSADTLDVIKDPLLDANLHKRRNARRDELDQERSARGDLDVVTELEILDERCRFGECLD